MGVLYGQQRCAEAAAVQQTVPMIGEKICGIEHVCLCKIVNN